MNPEEGSERRAFIGRLRREHYFYALWRLLLAVLLLALAFSPLFAETVVLRRNSLLQLAASLYLVIALLGLWLSRRERNPIGGRWSQR